MGYSVYERTFIVTISFLSDNACFRLVAKMMAEKCFLKNLKGAYVMLNQVNKDFVKEHGKEAIEDSMRMLQKNVQVLVCSKMPADKYEGGKDAFGTKALTNRFNEMAAKLEIPAKDIIQNKPIQIDDNAYTKYKLNISSINDVFRALILSSINGQRIDYVIHNNAL